MWLFFYSASYRTMGILALVTVLGLIRKQEQVAGNRKGSERQDQMLYVFFFFPVIFQKEERPKENKPWREERLSDPRNMCLTLGLREPWRSASKPQVRAWQVHRTLGARIRLREKKKGREGEMKGEGNSSAEDANELPQNKTKLLNSDWNCRQWLEKFRHSQGISFFN